MLTGLCLVIAVLAVGDNLAARESQIQDAEDNWNEPRSETGNEIAVVADVDELGERLRKRVTLLKADNKIELVFLIDSSSSIGEENFKSELKFVQKMVADFEVGPSDARVCVIVFASFAKIHVNHFVHGEHEKCSFLHLELPKIEYTGGNTNTVEALLRAHDIFNGSREGAGKALFLVTDGFSNKGDPIPVAENLKDNGITIFTFGIQTGNVREIRKMSSLPIEDHSFVLESFSEFEALARRALHEDLKSGSYMVLNNTGLCDVLCLSANSTPGNGCCNSRSSCSCGILTGHFACLCPPGFYGTGLVGEECLPCPSGTYNDGLSPGDITVCKACPDNNHATRIPATSEDDCVCGEGYVSVDGECEDAYSDVRNLLDSSILSEVLAITDLDLIISPHELTSIPSTQVHDNLWNPVAVSLRRDLTTSDYDTQSQLLWEYSLDLRILKYKAVIPVTPRGINRVITCPVLTVPKNGYFVKKNCSNVLNAACGIRCSTGYKLRGSSVRVCQSNGNWSGESPTCVPKSCKKPKPVRDSTVSCKNEDNSSETTIEYDSKGNRLGNDTDAANDTVFIYSVDTVCVFKCLPGYTMIGSKTRTCLPILQWNGLSTSCTVVNCPSLSVLRDGFIKPENCTEKGLRHDFATECGVSCKAGYRLEGPSLRNCTGRRGTWTGKNVPNKCIDIEPPVFKCPENITVETVEEESYALVSLSLPNGTDNSGMEPIIWSKPPFLPEYPLPLKIGTTTVEVYGIDESDNGDFCSFTVQVQDNETPKIFNCESPPTFYISDLEGGDMELNWTEPIFTDNSDTPLTIDKSHDFGNFSLGTTSVVYFVTDASGNSANCTLNITVAENPCVERFDLGNVEWNCSSQSGEVRCTLSCPRGMTWTTNNDISDSTFTCRFDRSGAKWHPDIFSDVDAIPECSVFEMPTEVVEAHEIEVDGSDFSCDDITQLSKEVSNEINILVGSDEVAKISVSAVCEEEDGVSGPASGEEGSNYISVRKKRNSEKRKRVRVHVSFIGQALNKTSNEEMATRLHELGQKVDEKFAKGAFIQVDGKKVGVNKAKVTSAAKARCRAGFAFKRGLCVKCPPGTFYDTSKSNCAPCPIGTYQNSEGRSYCEPCPSGHSTRRRRRKNIRDCKKICPPGTFGRVKNKTKTALTPCYPCPVGSYQPHAGQSSCEECPPGKTTKKKGSSQEGHCIDELSIGNPCYNFPCKNNGTCFVYNGYPSCLCSEGYLGSFCERERNHCDSSPCYNNAECVPQGHTSFTCICPAGYEGDLCESEVDECLSNPCSNNAVCADSLNGYQCDCLPGFAGKNCEEDINECELLNNPCLNNGVCNDLVNDYSCTCGEGFSGRHCEQVSHCDADDLVDENCQVREKQVPKPANPCTGVVCPNNMECVVAAGNRNLPLCICRNGFYGRDCGEEINFNVVIEFVKRSVTEYISAKLPPEDIREISACLWIQTADAFNYGTLFSYAVKDNDNAFTVTDYNGFVLYVRNERIVTDVVANDGHWHFICITWESSEGHWNIYFDGKNRGNGTGLSAKHAIEGGGIFVIGQEQDRFGGGFNEVESFVGKITHFDLWKRILEPSEIEDMNENCKYFEGDLFSWLQFLQNMHGNIQVSKSSFCTNCNVRELRIHKGRISIDSVGDSTFAVYKCDEGFRIRPEGSGESSPKDTGVWYRKCLKHGDWEPAVPTCIRISCGFPGYIPHGTIIGNSYSFSDIIKYKCNPGYSLVGNDTRICTKNGDWSGDKPVCKGNTGFCEEILAPRHGSMFINSRGKHRVYLSSTGDRAEFVCDEGHILRGHRILTCTEEGLWDYEVPTCEEISCYYPNELREYVVNSTSAAAFTAGEVLLVKCASIEEELKLIECQQTGSWNNTEGICGRKCEGRPNYPEHGLQIGDPLKYAYDPGEKIGVRCRYGFKLFGDNAFTCAANGTWYQKATSECKIAECVKPVPPPNSYALSDFNTYIHGSRVVFQCSNGYRQFGNLMTRCDGDGKWTKLFGRCLKMP